MENETNNTPGQEWDLEYQLEMIQQAINTNNYDKALDLAQEGFEQTKDEPKYQERFKNALKYLKLKTIPEDPKNTQKGIITQFRLTDINGIGPSIAEKLHTFGIHTPQQLSLTEPHNLSQVNGISEKTAEKYIISAKNLLENVKNYSNKCIKQPKPKKTSKISSKKEKNKFDIHKQNSTRLDQYLEHEITVSQEKKETPSLSQHINKSSLQVQEEVENEKKKNQKVEPEIEGKVKDYAEFIIPKQVSKLNSSQNKYSLMPKERSENIEIPEEDQELISTPQNKMQSIKKQVSKILSANGYFISKKLDIDRSEIIAIKSFEISNHQNIVLFIPIKIYTENIQLIVSENNIELSGIDPADDHYGSFTHTMALFAEIKSRMFHSIIKKDYLYQFLQKFLRTEFTPEYNQIDNEIYLHNGLESYKIVISPLFLSQKRISFKEKRVSYPYQRHNNIHFVHPEELEEVLTFLERKHTAIFKYSGHDFSTSNASTYEDFLAQIRIYSIPFFIISILFFILSIPLYKLILNVMIGLSITTFICFLLFLGYLYYTHYHSSQINSSHLKDSIKQEDLELIKRDFSIDEMKQFIYEYFGKNLDLKLEDDEYKSQKDKNNCFPFIKESQNNDLEDLQDSLPEDATKEEEINFDYESDENKMNTHKTQKLKLIQKYTDLLED